jgi:hypothetical protein
LSHNCNNNSVFMGYLLTSNYPMKKLIKLLCLSAILMGGAFNINADTNTVSTNQPVSATVSKLLDTKRFVFTFEEEFRSRDDNTIHGLFYEHSDIQAKYLINKYVDVFTDYRLILQDKGTGFKNQSMFIEGFNLKYPESTNWGKINLRTRLEIGLNPAGTDDTYQLNIFPKYNTPWKWTKFKINPFVANELFLDTVHDFNFVKNRIYAGFDYTITPKIKGGVWYYREAGDPGSNKPWTHADVAVAQIRYEF